MLTLRTLVQLSFSSSLGLGLFLLFSLISSSTLHEDLVVHRSIDKVPDAFIQSGKPNSDQQLQLTIGLASPNMSLLEKKLYEISDHNHPNYGQYLTKEETENLARPDANVTTAVNIWLSLYNISPVNATPAGNRLRVTMSVSQAEQVFNTSLYVYNHTLSGQSIIRAKQYSVPKALVNDIEFVHPIASFSPNLNNRPRRAGSRTAPPSNLTKIIRREECDPQAVTVNRAMQLYHIPADMEVPATEDEILVIAFNGQAVRGADVGMFMNDFRGDVHQSRLRLEIVSIGGGDSPDIVSFNDNFQADADVEMVVGVAPDSQLKVLASDTLDDVFSFLLNQETMGTVVSWSFINAETDDASAIELMKSLCKDIMQIVSRGVTFVGSSGDAGADGRQLTGLEPLPSNCTAFVSFFPGNCPFVLSVGATQLSSGGTEMAASFSSGGFSNVFPMPAYQTAAVGRYLSQIGSLDSEFYNSSGRGIPDVSAIYVPMGILDGEIGFAGGTTVSTPLVAGIIAVVNDHRRAAGKGTLGFINPWLYANPGVFTDITQGSNTGCNTGGFPALEGWDAVTGMGTLLFDKLLTKP